MSYLHDKNERNKKIYFIGGIFVICIIILIYWKPVFSSIARGAQYVFSPFFSSAQSIGGGLDNLGERTRTKKHLMLENNKLQEEIIQSNLQLELLDARQREIDELRELLGRISKPEEVLLADVIARPGVSLYDTLIVNVGEDLQVKQGSVVKAHGTIPIGYVSDVYKTSSRITLYSAPGVKSDGIVEANNLWTILVGRGGGGFEINLPQSIVFTKGMQVVAPGDTHELLATAEEIISDPRDPGQTILLSSPVNIHELTHVVIVK